MKVNHVSAIQLLDLLGADELISVSKATGVDYKAKKLPGKLVLQLLLYGLLSGKELSWRVLEVLAQSRRFQYLADLSVRFETDHSSLAERVSHIKLEYFKTMFERVGVLLEQRCPPQVLSSYKLVSCDSTFVSLAASLLKMGGMNIGVPTRKKKDHHPVAVKFSVGFKGIGIKNARFYHTPEQKSDDLSLRQLIREQNWEDKEIAVFDRGLQSRDAFDEFSEKNIKFVTRLKRGSNGSIKYKEVGKATAITPEEPIITESLVIWQDLKVLLYGKTNQPTRETYRLIIATIIDSEEDIYFLSNIDGKELDCEQITEVYKKRWQIEVFFKLLKQEFNFKHLLSRNENGIQVVLFSTLIAAMLVLVYKQANQIEGYKMAKLRFMNDLEVEILKKIVELCQGNPHLLDYFTIW